MDYDGRDNHLRDTGFACCVLNVLFVLDSKGDEKMNDKFLIFCQIIVGLGLIAMVAYLIAWFLVGVVSHWGWLSVAITGMICCFILILAVVGKTILGWGE